jgi:AraC family transcriptional regulator
MSKGVFSYCPELSQRLADANFDMRVRLCLDYLAKNFHRELSLQQLAELSRVSVWHFCRLFKDNTGISPGRYIKLLRMHSAADLLIGTTMSVKEVMNAVGINDESHFVRDFRDVIGVFPTLYRQKMKSEYSQSVSTNEQQIWPILSKMR